MPSFGKCTALAAGLFGAVLASPHHMARGIHQKKDIPLGNDLSSGIAAVAPAVVSSLFRTGVLNGLNTKTGPIAMENDQGAYVVDFINTNNETDVDLVLWSAVGQVGTWSALTINVTPANITTTIPAGGNMTVSFNPSEFTAANGYPGAAGAISGAWCQMDSNTPVSTFGGCDNTWGEFTFVHDSPFSTVDVSQLVNMNGNNMVITTFPEKGAQQACISDFNNCVYKCNPGESTCYSGECQNCAGNTGCMGMGSTSGYVQVFLG